MSLLLCGWNHQRGELTSFKLHFYGSSCNPHPFFLLIMQKNNFLECNGIFFKTYFSLKLMSSCFWSSTNRPVSMACPFKEIFNNLFFRFFRNLCNILHECDSSATPEKPGTNEGVAIILYHQNHGLGKFYISKHYLWRVSNLIFLACLFLPQSLNLVWARGKVLTVNSPMGQGKGSFSLAGWLSKWFCSNCTNELARRLLNNKTQTIILHLLSRS